MGSGMTNSESLRDSSLRRLKVCTTTFAFTLIKDEENNFHEILYVSLCTMLISMHANST